jgi:hypothetical protein
MLACYMGISGSMLCFQQWLLPPNGTRLVYLLLSKATKKQIGFAHPSGTLLGKLPILMTAVRQAFVHFKSSPEPNSAEKAPCFGDIDY